MHFKNENRTRIRIKGYGGRSSFSEEDHDHRLEWNRDDTVLWMTHYDFTFNLKLCYVLSVCWMDRDDTALRVNHFDFLPHT